MNDTSQLADVSTQVCAAYVVVSRFLKARLGIGLPKFSYQAVWFHALRFTGLFSSTTQFVVFVSYNNTTDKIVTLILFLNVCWHTVGQKCALRPYMLLY